QSIIKSASRPGQIDLGIALTHQARSLSSGRALRRREEIWSSLSRGAEEGAERSVAGEGIGPGHAEPASRIPGVNCGSRLFNTHSHAGRPTTRRFSGPLIEVTR